MNETTNPIRVLQIGMHNKIGGVETCLMNYYRKLQNKDIQFDFVTTFDTICFEKEINELGGKVYKICSEKKNPLMYYKQLKKIIKENQYNIVHINMLSAANVLPIIVAKMQKVKNIIVHSHNTNTPKGIVRKIMHFISKPFLNLATDYFACSEKAGEWLFGNKILKNNELKIINNAIDIKKYQFNEQKRQKIRKQFNIEDKYVVGHIGRFSYQKNHEFIINTFFEFQKKNENAVLMLIGEGEIEEDIKNMVKKYEIGEKVIFCGTTNHVEDYLQAMDVFIIPSRFEGLGIVAIEAQMNGLKVVASDELPLESKITNNISYLSLNDNISNWIKELENNRTDRNEDIEFLNSNYDIEKGAEKLSKIYTDFANEKIKIAHIVYGLVNGGVECMIYNYFSHFCAQNYEITMISQQESNKSCEEKFKALGANIHIVPKKKENAIGNFVQIYKILKKEKIQIVHSHMTMANFYPSLIARMAGVKTIISHSHLAYENEGSLKNKIYSLLGRILATDYLACTEDAAKYLFGNKNFEKGKVKIIKNAIDCDKFVYDEKVRKELREKYDFDDKFVIGHIGRFVEQKNHDFIIDIAKYVIDSNPKSEILLIGNGELQETINKKIVEYKLENKVKILEPRDNISQLMQAMDLFILPSKFEGLGIVLIEAQATGLRCIASNYIPQETNITPIIKYLKLEDGVNVWGDEILSNNLEYKRNSYTPNIEEAGYEIKSAAKDLDKYYKEKVKKI